MKIELDDTDYLETPPTLLGPDASLWWYLLIFAPFILGGIALVGLIVWAAVLACSLPS